MDDTLQWEQIQASGVISSALRSCRISRENTISKQEKKNGFWGANADLLEFKHIFDLYNIKCIAV